MGCVHYICDSCICRHRGKMDVCGGSFDYPCPGYTECGTLCGEMGDLALADSSENLFHWRDNNFPALQRDYEPPHIDQLQSQSYTYALQRWRNPYQLYEVTRNVALEELELLLVTVDTAFANYVPGADNTLEQQIKYKYVRINHESVYLQRTLMTQLQTSDLLGIMYNSARVFVARNRPLNELVYFGKLFFFMYAIQTSCDRHIFSTVVSTHELWETVFLNSSA
jgi:hypothetical protein